MFLNFFGATCSSSIVGTDINSQGFDCLAFVKFNLLNSFSNEKELVGYL